MELDQGVVLNLGIGMNNTTRSLGKGVFGYCRQRDRQRTY